MTRNVEHLLEEMIRGRVTRREFLIKATALGVSLAAAHTLLSSCAPESTPEPTLARPTATPQPPARKSLVVGLGGETASLDLNYEMNALGYSIYPALYEWLFTIDPHSGEILPGLATDWIQIDDLTWEFKLREGVKFHNGEEFDAQDVYDTTMGVLLSDPPATMIRRIEPVEAVDIVDKYTVRFRTKRPFVLLLPGLASGSMAIYPSEYYKKVGQAGFAAAPVGTGPWKFKEWNRGVSISLEKFEDYWGEPALIDDLRFQFYAEAGTRLAALETGEIDVAANVPPDDVERLRSAGLGVAWTPLGQSMLLQFVPRRGSILEDRRIRQAINYAIDKESLVNDLMLGFAAELNGQMLGKDCFGYNPQIKAYPYDPDKAKELLAEAGYANGFSIKMHGSTGRYAKHKEVEEALVGQLAGVGINVELELAEWATFSRMYQKTLDTHPMFYIGWNYMPAMDADFALQHVMCSSPRELFCDPSGAMDELFDRSREEFDREARRKLLQELQAVMHEECPVAFLFQAPDIWGTSPRVRDLTPTPDNALKFFGVSVED